MKEITYLFWNNKLVMVSIEASRGDTKTLSAIAQAKYGFPIESNRFIVKEKYRKGDTICTVEDKLTYSQMLLVSASLLDEYSRAQKDKVKEAASSF